MIKKSIQSIIFISLFIHSNIAFADFEDKNIYYFIATPSNMVGKNSKNLVSHLKKSCQTSKETKIKPRGNYSNFYECQLDDETITIGINLQTKTNTTDYFALLAPEKSYQAISQRIKKNNGNGYKIDNSSGSSKING